MSRSLILACLVVTTAATASADTCEPAPTFFGEWTRTSVRAPALPTEASLAVFDMVLLPFGDKVFGEVCRGTDCRLIQEGVRDGRRVEFVVDGDGQSFAIELFLIDTDSAVGIADYGQGLTFFELARP